MVVQVRLFAGLRERAGWSERDLDVADGASVVDVWPLLELGERPGGLLYAVNLEYAREDRVLQPGDEVALIPPVSGGAFRLTDLPIDPSAVVAEVADDQAGAIATFLGTTRVESRGRTVHYLDYEAYGGMAEKVMAERVMQELAAELAARHEITAIAIHHRVGVVEIGQPSVVIAVSAPNRAAALTACREAIDTLKTSVPLWKKEVYADGHHWIGERP